MSLTQNISRIKRFDGTNYPAWRNRVYTELQCDGLTDLVDQKPTEDQKKKTFSNEKYSWTQANVRARRIIIENLTDSFLHYAPVKITAHEVWRRLRVTYSRCSYLQHAYLRRKLSNLRYDGKTEISAFFKEFDQIIEEIRSTGGKVGKIEEIEVVVTLLSCLPSEFAAVISSFGEINDNSLITLETVKGTLLDFDLERKDEQKVKVKMKDSKSTAFFSNFNVKKSENSKADSGYTHQPRVKKKGNKSDTFKDSKAKRHCGYCDKDGHWEKRCFTKRNDQKKNEANIASGQKGTPAVAFLTEKLNTVEGTNCLNCENDVSVEIKFAADSGCNKFMMNQRNSFSSMRKLDREVPISLADESVTYATHTGRVDLVTDCGKRVTFNDVLYAPGLRRNLLSIRKVTLGDYEVVFKRDSVEIRAENGEIIATGYVENDLYFMNFSICSQYLDLPEVNLTYSQVHRRLGHLNESSIQLLKRQGLVDFSGEANELCESCVW